MTPGHPKQLMPSSLVSFFVFPRFKKAANDLGKISFEGTNRVKRNIFQTVLPPSFHHLRNAAKSVDVHYNE